MLTALRKIIEVLRLGAAANLACVSDIALILAECVSGTADDEEEGEVPVEYVDTLIRDLHPPNMTCSDPMCYTCWIRVE